MKKYFLSLLMLLFGVLSYAAKDNTTSTIKGYCKTDKAKEIFLFTISEGQTLPYAKTKLADDGSFAFTFKTPYEGFYVIGTESILGEQTPVYLKKGDNAELSIENKKVTFSKNNTPENIVVADWTTMSENIKKKSIYFNAGISNFEDFFPEFEKFVPEAEKFASNIKTKNSKFNAIMKDAVKYDTDLYAINFLCTPRTKHPTMEQRPAYYSTIVKENYFSNDNVLNILYGDRFLRMYADFDSRDANNFDRNLARLSSDIQKGTYLLGRTSSIKTYEDYTEFVNKYGKYFTTPAQKLVLEDLGAKLYETKAGTKAANFTYPDINGKMVSLSDFVGKVVLVDVWATWCGPCKKEIPYLKKLEEELHNNKDIVFMGVSVDEAKDIDTWKKMVKDENLEGVQLFASGWSKIAKDYKITGIPRFLVFDKKGNIHSIDAPRPSKPELKEMLLKLAAQ